jgi:hypothetical protein
VLKIAINSHTVHYFVNQYQLFFMELEAFLFQFHQHYLSRLFVSDFVSTSRRRWAICKISEPTLAKSFGFRLYLFEIRSVRVGAYWNVAYH